MTCLRTELPEIKA
jgi:hypothetical protein